MRCIVGDDLDQEFLKARVQEVLDTIEGEEDLDFTYVFTSGKEDCTAMADELDVQDPEDFITHCQKPHSSSFRSGGDEYLAVQMDEPFLQEDRAACRGLIAHELAHTIQRDTGIEDRIEDAAAEHASTVPAQLERGGFSEVESIEFIETVLSTTVFCLKDIFANSLLIEQGLTDDLLAYYTEMLGIEEFCPQPEFYQDDEAGSVEEVNDAMQFELQLVPAWLPFTRCGPEKHQLIHDRISECYQGNIPGSGERSTVLEAVYADAFDDPDAFIDRFMDTVTAQWLDAASTVRDRPNQTA